MAFGIDISEHQGYWAPDQFNGWDFAILRARNENGYNDRRFADHWRSAADRTARGVYGWPIAGAGIETNYAAGLALVRDFPGSEFGYWADVEHSGRGTAEAQEVEAYCRGIQDAGGAVGFYSNIGELPRSPYLDSLPWWMADYGPNNGERHDPDAQAPRPPQDRPWAIHQFTSAGGLDVNFAPSLSIFTGTPARPSPKRKVSDLYVAIIFGFDGLPYAYLVSGHVILGDFPAEPRGIYAIPQAAIDFAGDSIVIKNLSELATAPANLVKASAAAYEANKVTVLPSVPAPEPPPVPQPGGPLIPPPSIEQVLRHAAESGRWSTARESILHDLALRGA